MKKIAFLCAMALILSLNSCQKNPFLKTWNTPYGVPPFQEIKYSDYIPAIKAGIQQKQEEINKIVNNEAAATFDNTIKPYELSGQILERVTGVLYNLSESDNSPEFQKIMEEAAPMLSKFNDQIFMNKALFNRIKTIYDSPEHNFTPEQKTLVKKLYTAFKLNGVDLDSTKQARLQQINQQLSLDQEKFSSNLLAANNDFEKLCGFPASEYYAKMASTADRALRKKYFEAYSSRCNSNSKYDNTPLCLEILKLRAEKANLLGFDNFANYKLSDQMANNAKVVDDFLEKIMKAADKKAAQEVKDLQKIMNRDIKAKKLPKGSVIEPWDYLYYAEILRKEKYNLDEAQTRPYFELSHVRDGAFAAAHKLYGITVSPIKDIPTYNPQAKAFKVCDADGSLLGVLYTDYLPRSSKRGGAWMNNILPQYVNAQNKDVRPVIVNVANLTPPTDSTPSLLSIDNVQTLFHEFGHALHGLLTKCHYVDVSGTNVTRDFVETFSQFNENWAFQPEILALYAKNYKTGAIIPDSLVQKINNASKFNQGFATSELCAASIIDMKLHELSLKQLDTLNMQNFVKRECKAMGLVSQIIPRYLPTYFAHIFSGGYSAGYYGYLWSEVLDKDAFAYFKEKGLYNPEVAKKFRQTFLEKGGSEDPMKLFIDFRGRKPDPTALIEARGLDEN